MSPAPESLNFHEDLQSHQHAKTPSDRMFGFTLAAVSGSIGILRLAISGGWFSFVLIALGLITLGITLKKPTWIAPVKNAALKIAPKISALMTPILMGFIFAVCFIPGGLILRMMREDLIEKKPDPYRVTYWEKREAHGLPDPMKYQF